MRTPISVAFTFANGLQVAILLAISTSITCAHAAPIEWLPHYNSGKETCAPRTERTSNELGRWVDVPIDYSHRLGARTPIYFWTLKPISPELPFLVFAAGGPGSSMHSNEFPGLDAEFNVIYFDPRGMNCSKPDHASLYRDPAFYSSESIARDIEEIRKTLGAPQISIYGHSYGTVVATIYGSLFPRATRAVILEGTIARGGDPLYRTEATRALMQAQLESFDEPLRSRILELSRDPDASPSWYSRAAHFMMYFDDPFSKLDYWIRTTFEMTGADLHAALKTFDDGKVAEDEFGFGLMLHMMISCQELGQDSHHAGFYYVFDSRGQLIPEDHGVRDHQTCHALGAQTRQLYSSSRYPLAVPVTYFQGETDGATPVAEARAHFERVPRGFAQFLSLEKGGHQPNQQALHELPHADTPAREAELNRLQRQIFAEAAAGERIPSARIEQLNALSPLRWTYSVSGERNAQSGL